VRGFYHAGTETRIVTKPVPLCERLWNHEAACTSLKCGAKLGQGLSAELRQAVNTVPTVHCLGEAGQVPFPTTEDIVIAALLNGPEVARIVNHCSDSFVEGSGNKKPWEDRKRGYIERLKAEPEYTLLVSAADADDQACRHAVMLRLRGWNGTKAILDVHPLILVSDTCFDNPRRTTRLGTSLHREKRSYFC
jgi:hypothetical protein